MARWLSDEQRFAYLAPDGFSPTAGSTVTTNSLVERVIASSAAVTRAIWGIVASHSSIASTVQATVGPADPVQWLTTDPDVSWGPGGRPGCSGWWTRPRAVAGRGFPPGIGSPASSGWPTGTAYHDGWWTLDVAKQQGRPLPGRTGTGPASTSQRAPGWAHGLTPALTLGPRGFAALYAGTPLATLRRAGLVAGGDPGGDAVLDAAFGADPFMLEFF
jgi:hypothetical protein